MRHPVPLQACNLRMQHVAFFRRFGTMGLHTGRPWKTRLSQRVTETWLRRSVQRFKRSRSLYRRQRIFDCLPWVTLFNSCPSTAGCRAVRKRITNDRQTYDFRVLRHKLVRESLRIRMGIVISAHCIQQGETDLEFSSDFTCHQWREFYTAFNTLTSVSASFNFIVQDPQNTQCRYIDTMSYFT